MQTIVIDENDVQRRILRLALEKRGHEVRGFSEGKKALDSHIADPADIVILDWALPDTDGLAVSRGIKENDALMRRQSYLIMVSSKNEIDEMLFALDHGVDDFVSKPVDLVLMSERISQAEDALVGQESDEAEGEHPFQALEDEHMYLRGIGHIIDVFCRNNCGDDINIEALNMFSKKLLVLDIRNHHEKEKRFIDYFIDVLSRSTNNWFTAISETSFTDIQEQHEELENLFSELQGYISIYQNKQREMMELLKRTIAQFDISMSIDEGINETERYVKEMGQDLDLYFRKKTEAIAPIKQKLAQYNKLLMRHIQFEEERFFPFALRYLDDDDLREVGRIFDEVEREVGKGLIEKEEKEILQYIHDNLINPPEDLPGPPPK